MTDTTLEVQVGSSTPEISTSTIDDVQIVSVEAKDVYVVTSQETVVVSSDVVHEAIVYTEGSQGPAGQRGQTGLTGGLFERNTSGSMSALRVVWEGSDGIVHALDKDDGDHIGLIAGLTITATGAEGSVVVQRAGPVDDDAWSWVTSGLIWLGDSGIPTQTPPTTGYDVQIGYAVSPTRIYLDIQPPINLE